MSETERPPAAFLSVWPVAQKTAREQRRGRYQPGSTAHPGKMLPELARTVIRAYSNPGELVLDPMCGIGTHWSRRSTSSATRSASSSSRAGRRWRPATSRSHAGRARPLTASAYRETRARSATGYSTSSQAKRR
jgi:DNA methylase